MAGSSVKEFNAICKENLNILSYINPLQNDRILDRSKLKAFADNKVNVAQKLKFVYGRVEYIVGKGEYAVCQHFLLFPQCYQNSFLLEGVLKNQDCVVKVKD